MLGARGGMLAWGIDLGLGLTTRLPYQGVAVLLLFALLSGNLITSTLIMLLYGICRGVAVALAIVWSGEDHSDACRVLSGARSRLSQAAGLAALLSVAGLVAVSI